MEIINISNNKKYLKEYAKLCYYEWSSKEKSLKSYINSKLNNTNNNIISVLALIDNHTLIGFISLFKQDDDTLSNLTPWYATMYVKKEYRNKGYSKLLNDALLKEAKSLGYKKVYLKSTLVNYYEKFGAKEITKFSKTNEKVFYIDLN